MQEAMANQTQNSANAHVKINPPEKFDGELAQLKTFLTGMKLCCRFNDAALPVHTDKILAAGMRMKGKAGSRRQRMDYAACFAPVTPLR
jgi:hypothetical protein